MTDCYINPMYSQYKIDIVIETVQWRLIEIFLFRVCCYFFTLTATTVATIAAMMMMMMMMMMMIRRMHIFIRARFYEQDMHSYNME